MNLQSKKTHKFLCAIFRNLIGTEELFTASRSRRSAAHAEF